MKQIVFCGYREWAFEIYDFVKDKYNDKLEIILVKDPKEFDKLNFYKIKPIAVFFIGWSWIIKPEIINNCLCICLHPSSLPKYRGGSPIQNQIINGEKESAVTYFKMNNEIDAGPIIWQQKFSLEGDLKDIFSRISETGKKGFFYILNTILDGKTLKMTPQDNSKATMYKRRKPEQSEIKLEDFKNYTATELYNKIRCLQDPYPNAYVVCKNNTRLYIKKASTENE